MLNRRLSIAPMLDWTDRYFRYFVRLISRHTLLYTEMVTTAALLHREPERFLEFDPRERPLALQLGGSNPAALAACSRMGEKRGYDEINLNLGCPSDRVQSGRFGACLMAEPDLVADCVKAMIDAVSVPVTVKQRTGIDDLNSYGKLCDFVGTLHQAGCRTFIVHARQAWLKGLSPQENREIPPLDYDRVYALKRDFPECEIVVNGGVKTLEECEHHLEIVDGVMIGREAYKNPWILADADGRLFSDPHPLPTRQQIVDQLVPFVEAELAKGTPLIRILRHTLGLFKGQPGARTWRRQLSVHAGKRGADGSVLKAAAEEISRVNW
jgi:tRNA-dihydrouridine synthase A